MAKKLRTIVYRGVLLEVSAKRARTINHNCYCDGWWWSARGGPHRIGSRASGLTIDTAHTSGCRYQTPRRVVDLETGAPF